MGVSPLILSPTHWGTCSLGLRRSGGASSSTLSFALSEFIDRSFVFADNPVRKITMLVNNKVSMRVQPISSVGTGVAPSASASPIKEVTAALSAAAIPSLGLGVQIPLLPVLLPRCHIPLLAAPAPLVAGDPPLPSEAEVPFVYRSMSC